MKLTPMRSFYTIALTIVVATGIFTGCDPNANNGPSSANTASILANIPKAEVSRVTAIKERHEDEILSKAGVVATGVGVGTGSNAAVWVFTSDANAKDIPSEIDGVPTHIEYVGEVKALAAFTGTYRNPMWSGVSVGNDNECAAGTISCVVTDGTKTYLLSNNHVFARENAAKNGEKIDQPGRYETNCGPSGQVASLSKFIPIVMKRNASNVVDCAIAEVLPGLGQTTQMALNSYTPTANPMTATVGMNVKKTGRTTGLTTGSVSAINVTVTVQYSHGSARFVNQVYVTPGTFSAAGDSGSLICEASSNDPVALLFAGSSSGTFGNPISSVLSQLGVSIVPF